MENINVLDSAYTISIFLILLSTTVSTLELSAVPKYYFNFIYPKIESIALDRRKWTFIHILQIVCAVGTGILFYIGNVLFFKLTFLILTALNLYSYFNRKVSKDGADQVRILALLSFSLCFLLEDSTGQLISMGFMGLQVLLGYMTSGIAKLMSPYWRRGNVLHLIFGTYSFGIPKVAKFLKNHPMLERMMSYSAILVMLAVPISFFIPHQYAMLITLAGIFSFHFATAIIMGLNDFLITFPIAYPGILILHGLLHNYITL